MKGTIVAAAAILAGGASAHRLNHRHLHQPLFEKRVHNDTEICVPGCTTIWTTITGPAGRMLTSKESCLFTQRNKN